MSAHRLSGSDTVSANPHALSRPSHHLSSEPHILPTHPDRLRPLRSEGRRLLGGRCAVPDAASDGMPEDHLSGRRLQAGHRRGRTVPDDACDAVPDPDDLCAGDGVRSAVIAW